MAVPTYDELLAHYDTEKSIMKQTFNVEDLRQFSLTLDMWETLAKFLGIPNSDTANIKSQGDAVEQKLRMLECWKQRRGSMATYEAMVKALLQISRTDLAEKVITLRQFSKDTSTLEAAITNPYLSSPNASSLRAPTSPVSSNKIQDASLLAASPMSLSSPPATTSEHSAQRVIQTLQDLENEFYELVTFVEATLKTSNVQIDTITRRFSMLPQLIRRQHETDESYKETRRRILDSETVKKLFDNLTELKHWNYMTPDTLAHILKDVKNDDIHKKVVEYKNKLMAFKTKTKLRELIGISFPVPDYCMELTMEVEGWEDKTIQEVENRAVNIVRRAAYSGCAHVSLGWKGVMPGSIRVMFILMESINLVKDKLIEDSAVLNVQIDGDIFHSKDYTKAASSNSEIPGRLWYSTGTMWYNAVGGRDVLILAPDLSHPHPEAVARRPSQLTKEDKLKLQSQGLPPHCKDELDIVKARCKLDKRLQVVGVKSGQSLSREEVIESMNHLLSITQNDGVVLYYIGAGRSHTGDWCFEDGFITFWDIVQLYLRASHNFKGRILTIISDCSYSGCWVMDCMEFLDEQGVQPCGHKARNMGMVIKVLTSCRYNEIPTKYCYSVDGIYNVGSKGIMRCKISKSLLETQTTDCIDSSLLHCGSKTIDQPCTLPPDFTWKLNKERRIS